MIYKSNSDGNQILIIRTILNEYICINIWLKDLDYIYTMYTISILTEIDTRY